MSGSLSRLEGLQKDGSGLAAQIITEQPDAYSDRNIVAQERIADASALMAWAAALTLAVTAIGTFFLIRQVRLTRKAVDETAKATLAMERQNELTEITSKRQLGAYVTFHSVEWALPDLMRDPYSLQVVWQNTGVTPALGLQSRVGLHVFKTEDDLRFDTYPDKGTGPLPVGPAQKFWSETLSLDQTDYNKIADGKQRAALVGIATYDDIFGIQHETGFCVEIKISGPPPKMVFLPFGGHNFMRTV